MKRIMSLVLSAVMIAGILAGCSNATKTETTAAPETSAAAGATTAATEATEAVADKSGESVEFMTGTAIDTKLYIKYQEMADAFTAANPKAAKIELIPSSTDHEGEVKTRLAGGNIPDMWMTHGWSLGRYSEYLLDLKDQPWAMDLNPALDSVMLGKGGELYALPINLDIAGILYNADVLEAAGYKAEDITTWEQFMACCDAINANGINPIYNAGKDRWPTGLYIDWIAPGAFEQADLDSMLAGTFVADKYQMALDMVQQFKDKNYFNKDYSSATVDDMSKALAQGKTGFGIVMNFALVAAFDYNPDANLGFMQIPAFSADKAPYYVAGEKDAIGVAKDGKNVDTCLAFLEFLAQPENLGALATSTGQVAGLTTATADLGKLTPSVEAAAKYGSVPYFDRVYMPGGAWDAIVATTEMVVTGQKPVSDAMSQIQSEFETLYK